MTPFGRQPMTAGLMKQVAEKRAERALPRDLEINKWELLRNLTTAASDFGLNRSALVVLQALLSFHKSAVLGAEDLVVFPSNRTLSSRAHGMPESTLRRNLATLVKAGLITRHDSPNGKRYAVHRGGDIARAFGFDLRPLVQNADRIAIAAQSAQMRDEDIRALREKATLLKRDAWKLLEYARLDGHDGPWEALEAALSAAQTRLRRKLSVEALEALCDALSASVDKLTKITTTTFVKTEETSACDDQNERHIQSSNKNKLESEPQRMIETHKTAEPNTNVPIAVVKQACPDILPYAANGISQNHDLVETAHHLHGMMGITNEVWHRAMGTMGAEQAALTLACMLQKIDTIRNPGGYLRSLTKKAEDGKFSVWPMLRALLPDGMQRAGAVV